MDKTAWTYRRFLLFSNCSLFQDDNWLLDQDGWPTIQGMVYQNWEIFTLYTCYDIDILVTYAICYTFNQHTVCPRLNLYSNLLYKIGQEFLDKQYETVLSNI